MVQARIKCTAVPTNSGSWPTTFTTYLLQDGSTISRGFGTHLGEAPTAFCSRDESCAQNYGIVYGRELSTYPTACPGAAYETLTIVAGTLEFCLDNVGVFETFDPSTYCTGFNLEAFGVTP